MIAQFRNEKVSNHGSIPITIDCNVVAFIVFEEYRPKKSSIGESCALKQVVAIHSGRTTEQAGQASGDILPKSHVRWLSKSGQHSLQVPLGRTHNGQGFPLFFKALGFLGGGSIFVNVCGYNDLCSSEGEVDFPLRRLGSLLGFLSSEEIEVANGRQADIEVRVIIIEALGVSVRSAEISIEKDHQCCGINN
ncbi:hypothetical protein TNCV_586141 [Trichonephila clavipes]|nr:hypothetical protein TNCV_586141 [Trichonephila clavipes]